MSSDNEKRKEELKELVLARLDIMPSNFKLSIDNQGTFNKDELKIHVQKGDKIGEQIIKMQLGFIKALTTGKLITALNQNC